MTVNLGTRGSELALMQARQVAARLNAHDPPVACEIVVIKTSGDRLSDASLSEIGGKRLFVKEIEDALLAGAIDLAVHSSKDMPAVLPEGLTIAAVLPREDARDALVLPRGQRTDVPVEEIARRLGRSARIGTSSVRRSAQLTRLFPGARFEPIRGNLDTRLRKLDDGHYDALVLAAAGLRRLARADRISATLPVDVCVPAPGQGIIAIETRADHQSMIHALAGVDDREAGVALAAERAVVTRLGGGCQMPIGAFARVRDGSVALLATVMAVDGSRAVRADASGPIADAAAVGATVAERLLAQGAGEILADVQRTHASVEGLQP